MVHGIPVYDTDVRTSNLQIHVLHERQDVVDHARRLHGDLLRLLSLVDCLLVRQLPRHLAASSRQLEETFGIIDSHLLVFALLSQQA